MKISAFFVPLPTAALRLLIFLLQWQWWWCLALMGWSPLSSASCSLGMAKWHSSGQCNPGQYSWGGAFRWAFPFPIKEKEVWVGKPLSLGPSFLLPTGTLEKQQSSWVKNSPTASGWYMVDVAGAWIPEGITEQVHKPEVSFVRLPVWIWLTSAYTVESGFLLQMQSWLLHRSCVFPIKAL